MKDCLYIAIRYILIRKIKNQVIVGTKTQHFILFLYSFSKNTLETCKAGCNMLFSYIAHPKYQTTVITWAQQPSVQRPTMQLQQYSKMPLRPDE